MPYFLFKITPRDEIGLVKDLELLQVFDSFRDAKAETRKLRAGQTDDSFSYKVTFAENRLAAEEQLLQKREKPVLMEHER